MNDQMNKIDNDNIAQDAAKRVRKTKIIIVSVFVGMLIFMIICLMVPGLLNGTAFDQKKNSDEPAQFVFSNPYPESFDIMTYDEYLGLDRGFHYCDDSTGQTDELTRESLQDYNAGVKVMYNMFEAIISGNETAYNALLSDKIEKKEPFTQQQVYNILVIGIDNRDTKESGYRFKVEYSIHENNGSFRTDIGSDMSKIQYFTVRKIDGKYLIDSITESNNK